MKNNISIFILLSLMLCLGCEGKKEDSSGQIHKYVRYHTINEKDLSAWDGLVYENDITTGPNGAHEGDVILYAESAAMIGDALKRCALQGKHVEESLKTVIDKGKYWIVQETTSSKQDDAIFVYITVIQKSNGKILDFRCIEK